VVGASKGTIRHPPPSGFPAPSGLAADFASEGLPPVWLGVPSCPLLLVRRLVSALSAPASGSRHGHRARQRDNNGVRFLSVARRPLAAAAQSAAVAIALILDQAETVLGLRPRGAPCLQRCRIGVFRDHRRATVRHGVAAHHESGAPVTVSRSRAAAPLKHPRSTGCGVAAASPSEAGACGLRRPKLLLPNPPPQQPQPPPCPAATISPAAPAPAARRVAAAADCGSCWVPPKLQST